MDANAFPGKLAGASLKLMTPEREHRIIACFPRQTCRGLIEAGSGGRTARGCTGSFPGKLAGASLKRLDERGLEEFFGVFPRQTCRGLIEAPGRGHLGRKPPPSFPGKLAGASLKQSALRRRRHGTPPDFPRQTCRGLIEAYSNPGSSAISTILSPANLPGPH